jgi:hypothetical protein
VSDITLFEEDIRLVTQNIGFVFRNWVWVEKRSHRLWSHCNERSKIHVNRLIFAGQGRQIIGSFNLNEIGEMKQVKKSN